MADPKMKKCAHIPCVARCRKGKSTAETPVALRAAERWRSRANATTHRSVHWLHSESNIRWWNELIGR